MPKIPDTEGEMSPEEFQRYLHPTKEDIEAELRRIEIENGIDPLREFNDFLEEDLPEAKKPTEITDAPIINASSLQGIECKPREWLLDGWIQRGNVTALYGDGGVGKSLVALQMMTCVSLGNDFFDIPTTKSKVFGYFCEDSADELHRRQYDINNHYGLEFKDLKDIYWQSRVGYDNTLMTFLREATGSPQKAYEILRTEVLKIGAQFVVIDTAADTFGGNENVRVQVRQFVNLLNKLAMEINGSVLLCAHPSAAGLARNDGTGASTAWNNTVRSRIYISRPVKDENAELIPGEEYLREFTKMKSNYSSVGDKIDIKWDHGAFSVVGHKSFDKVDQIERATIKISEEDLFLMILKDITESGRILSNSSFAREAYAPLAMKRTEMGRLIPVQKFEEAMERLFNKKKIKVEYVHGSDGKKKISLVAT